MYSHLSALTCGRLREQQLDPFYSIHKQEEMAWGDCIKLQDKQSTDTDIELLCWFGPAFVSEI